MSVHAAPVASVQPLFNLALLVDRDDDTRDMYRQYLASQSVEIDEASDGREALALALSRQPDVVVTETRLFGVDGYELCALLRRDVATSRTPIIVVTGDGSATAAERASDAGADSVLVKPCLPDILFTEMRRLIERSKSLRQQTMDLRSRSNEQISRARDLQARARSGHRIALSHAYRRHDTTAPALEPPRLVCPECDKDLTYQLSHIGGVNARNAEQWDYYECPTGCGTFHYRQRTRKLRKVE